MPRFVAQNRFSTSATSACRLHLLHNCGHSLEKKTRTLEFREADSALALFYSRLPRQGYRCAALRLVDPSPTPGLAFFMFHGHSLQLLVRRLSFKDSCMSCTPRDATSSHLLTSHTNFQIQVGIHSYTISVRYLIQVWQCSQHTSPSSS